MFYNSVPPRPFDAETDTNLRNAKYVLGFNEPELTTQANISPREAAIIWPDIVTIAEQYDLELVGPCGTIDRGRKWYRDWLTECHDMYGQACHFDFTCLHAYFYPEPCNGVEPWACLGYQASNAMTQINGWHREFGKKIWVTEIGCNPWGGKGCNADKHEETMRQLIPHLDNSNAVFRYAWFSANGFYHLFQESNTNEIVWEVSWSVACSNRKWVAEIGDTEWWQVRTVQDCIERADQKDYCHSPLVISMDGDGCYCAKDECSNLESVWPGMRTWREIRPRDSDVLSPLGELYQTI